MPPKLQAKASPNSNDFENLESVGRSLTIGKMIVAHKMGAVWLEIHIERNRPRSITARMNRRGRCPKITCSQDASLSSN